jgi:hypothetical protein
MLNYLGLARILENISPVKETEVDFPIFETPPDQEVSDSLKFD